MSLTSLDHSVVNHRQETHKLYSLLLPYSLYDNPSRQYSRKLKLKKQTPVSSIHTLQSHETHASEFMIISPYWVGNTTTSTGTNNDNSTIKIRKKMKLTPASIDSISDIEMPKLNNYTTEDEHATNLIIMKPVEYEKINSTRYSLAELRALCCHYGIKKSGTKTELSQRIYLFLKQTYFIVRIQRMFKSFLTKKY